MEEPKPVPLVFANQVIKLLGEHVLGDVKLTAQAFRVIRVVFRRLGGSWFEVCQGNPEHTQLLISSVTAWGARNAKDR